MQEQDFYVLLLLGVNGSGKTTLANELKKTSNLNIPLINMDLVGRRPYSSIEDYNDMMANNLQITRQMMEDKLRNKENFMTELTLSTSNDLEFLKHVKQQGALLITVFTLTRDVEMNMSRIAQRVSRGGHSVPTQKIKSRYQKFQMNLPAAIDESDICFVFDNSEWYKCILHKSASGEIQIYGIDPEVDWWVQEHIISGLKRRRAVVTHQASKLNKRNDLFQKIESILNDVFDNLKSTN